MLGFYDVHTLLTYWSDISNNLLEMFPSLSRCFCPSIIKGGMHFHSLLFDCDTHSDLLHVGLLFGDTSFPPLPLMHLLFNLHKKKINAIQKHFIIFNYGTTSSYNMLLCILQNHMGVDLLFCLTGYAYLLVEYSSMGNEIEKEA